MSSFAQQSHSLPPTGDLLLKRLLLAIPKAQSARCDFVELDTCLRLDRPTEIQATEEALAAWEKDQSSPDPYRLPKSSELFTGHLVLYTPANVYSDITLQQVRLLIAEEEKARAEAGTSATHDVTAGAFLLLGMDIQNLQ